MKSFMPSSTQRCIWSGLSQVLLPFLPTLILTYRWQSRSSWTQTLERGHNRCRIDTRRTPGVDCGQSLLGGLAQILGWSWDPRDSVPLMYHCPHRNCGQRKKNCIGVCTGILISQRSQLDLGNDGKILYLTLARKNYNIELQIQFSGSIFAQPEFEPLHCKQTNKKTSPQLYLSH